MRGACVWILASLICGALFASPLCAQDAEPDAPAQAQDETEGDEAPPPDAATPSTGPSEAASQEANERVARGEALYTDGDYDAALAEFERAHALMEGHPFRHLILYNIARAHQRRFRYDLALEYYRRYVSFGDANLPHREAATAALESLAELLATVVVRANVRSEVWIEDRQVGEAPGELLLPGGRHVLELRAAGHEPARSEIQIAPGTESTVDLTLQPLAESFEGLDPAFAVTSLLAAGVAAVIGAGLGVAVVMRRAEVDDALADPVARNTVGEDAIDEIQRLALGTDLSLGVAGLGLALGIVFALLTDWDGNEEAAVQANFGPGGAGVMARW